MKNLANGSLMRSKPHLNFWQIWNMCFGFLGIQIGFALQNSHVSRIFQTLGAKIDEIPILWIAAPLTGLLVQPIVGYLSDRTWGRFGRRRPYFLAGAILATFALFVMPNCTALWMAAAMLWILDASINVAMEPFRALIGDQLGPAQRPTGYSMQSFFIGIGAVGGSLPYFLGLLGVSNTALPGMIPDTVRYSFYLGGLVLMAAMSWTIFTTREYSPEQIAQFEDHKNLVHVDSESLAPKGGTFAMASLLIGIALAATVWFEQWDKSLYVLAGLIGGMGAAMVLTPLLPSGNILRVIVVDFQYMPIAMRKLASVQFFSWFALFCMWIYMTSTVAQVHFGATDASGVAYNKGADWAGLLNGAYNGFAALAAFFIPYMSKRLGVRLTHAINLWLGALAFASFFFIKDPDLLLVSMIGVGFAWASILSIPYALLADHLPPNKMGTYMGIFNFFIVIPQLVAASVLGFLLRKYFDNQPIYAFMIGACSFVIAGLLALRVPTEPETVRSA
jgi:maltose/moltooligosaccharide transporter